MQIVYWAHSYRPEDARINEHFGLLIEKAERMIINFDPPSRSVNEAKLLQNLRSCDGMVAVLTWRGGEPSTYILFEIALALRAQKPVIVFLDDRLSGTTLPTWVPHQRFSHRTYFRQVREHVHALRGLRSYMGETPPAKFRSGSSQRGCGLIGWSKFEPKTREKLTRFVQHRGYRTLSLDKAVAGNPLQFDQYDNLSAVDVVLRYVDAKSTSASYWAGIMHASAIPSIAFTTDPEYDFNDSFPREFQPLLTNAQGFPQVDETLAAQFDLFEEDFLSTHDPAAIERYVKMQIEAGVLGGHYEPGTRQQFVGAIVGDQYNINGQAGAVGRHAHAHDMDFTQAWQQVQSTVDFDRLVGELRELREAMSRGSVEPEHQVAIGAIGAAEQSAKRKDGQKVMEYMKTAGNWALTIAEKIGVNLATAILKSALRFP